MQKKDIQVGEIYNMKYFNTMVRPVRIVRIGIRKVEVQYLDAKTLQIIPVPNPAVWKAMTEMIPLNKIKDKYVKAGA